MKEKTGIPGNPPGQESTDAAREQDLDRSTEQAPDTATGEAKEEIVIKQVPVDGICGGY